MTAPYLPDDCIYDILKHLSRYRYHSTLFNCLLVNRFWCKATVPLLYANPFGNTSSNFHLIILTLILCFSKEEILQLKNQLKPLRLIHNIDITINDEYKPLFEYPRYLENYDCSKIHSAISKWLNSLIVQNYGSKSHSCKENFLPIFYKSLFYRCNNNIIKQLNVPLDNHNVQPLISNLTKLISLKLYLEVTKSDGITSTPPLISNMANVCTLLQKQSNLKIIKLSQCGRFLDNIFSVLELHKHSLVCIEFHKVNFSNTSFKNFICLCNNLKYLKFHDCGDCGDTLNQWESLNVASFKLKVLIFENCYSYKWIEYLGASLKELILLNSISISIIENVQKYCPNLTTLEFKMIYNTNLSLFPYFKNFKIRTLNFYINEHFHNFEICTRLESLANNLPASIKVISVRGFSYIRFMGFLGFLENCHDNLETINIEDPIKSNCLKMILKYIERNNTSLKCLGVSDSGKVLNDEELNLLNQIKAKRVKLVNLLDTNYRSSDDYFNSIM